MTNENRIDKKFSLLRDENKKALITFITFGDPDIETSKKLVLEMEREGADLIEIGVPFSDPMAEGPVIQAANVRALKNEINLDKIFKAVSELRQETEIPLVFLMYFNSLLSYGIEDFFKNCAESGVDAVIIPDLPFEESGEIYDYTVKYNVYQISMITPTSSEERAKKICQRAKGFLYCVSSMGVTGMPKCLGFGISKPKHIEGLKHYCDGLIVGSAIVNQIAEGSINDEKVEKVGALTKVLAEAAHK